VPKLLATSKIAAEPLIGSSAPKVFEELEEKEISRIL
jgi:hypothetical protein